MRNYTLKYSRIQESGVRSQEEAVRWTGSPTCSNCRQLPFRSKTGECV
ncbi:hypothetical protein [Trichormus sp. NMC-1]|nr:hypothetical protein [Trichormus sp. NMC-1]